MSQKTCLTDLQRKRTASKLPALPSTTASSPWTASRCNCSSSASLLWHTQCKQVNRRLVEPAVSNYQYVKGSAATVAKLCCSWFSLGTATPVSPRGKIFNPSSEIHTEKSFLFQHKHFLTGVSSYMSDCIMMKQCYIKRYIPLMCTKPWEGSLINSNNNCTVASKMTKMKWKDKCIKARLSFNSLHIHFPNWYAFSTVKMPGSEATNFVVIGVLQTLASMEGLKWKVYCLN